MYTQIKCSFLKMFIRVKMTPSEVPFWQTVCGLLVFACARVSPTGFLATCVLVYFSLYYTEENDQRKTIPRFTGDYASARVVQEVVTQSEDKTPNWRKASPHTDEKKARASSRIPFHRTATGQPTSTQRNNLMRRLYEEMNDKR